MLSRETSVLGSTWGRLSLGALAAMAMVVERQNAALVLLPAGAVLLEGMPARARLRGLSEVLLPLLAAVLVLR